MAQEKINRVLHLIDTSVDDFVEGIPLIERRLYNKLLLLTKELDLDASGNIKNNLVNIRLIGKIKKELEAIILDKPYLKKVREFTTLFNSVDGLNREYLSSVFVEFKPKPVLDKIKEINIALTVDELTEAGIGRGLEKNITDVLKANITGGGSYADMIDVLKGQIIGTTEKEGYMTSYAQKVVVDAINQYNAQYIKSVTDDLGLEWFQYVGSIIKTSRQFCKSMTQKRYFHISEVGMILSGFIDGKKIPLNPKNNLPSGMIDGTNKANFFVYRGGHKCGHQIYPVSAATVPKYLRDRFS